MIILPLLLLLHCSFGTPQEYCPPPGPCVPCNNAPVGDPCYKGGIGKRSPKQPRMVSSHYYGDYQDTTLSHYQDTNQNPGRVTPPPQYPKQHIIERRAPSGGIGRLMPDSYWQKRKSERKNTKRG